jgi:16S rRNA (uracil1498-N3)-methyltransferase
VSAPHFFVDRLEPGRPAILGPEDARHALRSLRLRQGDEVGLADGAGAVGRGTLRVAGDAAAVDVDRPSPSVTVAMAAPKGDRLAWAVQKLAEVGAGEIALLESERAVRQWEGERGERTRRRLATVARQAAMQSKRPFVPELSGPWTLDRALRADPGVSVILLWEHATRPLADVVSGDARTIRLVVGPEGGFSDREAAEAEAAGAAPASLGEGILRTETAALAATVVTLHRLGRLG